MVQISAILFVCFTAIHAIHAKIEWANDAIQLHESILELSLNHDTSPRNEQIDISIEPTIEPTEISGQSISPTQEPSSLLPPSISSLPNVPATIPPFSIPPISPVTLNPIPDFSMPPIPLTLSPYPDFPTTDLPLPPIFSQFSKLTSVLTNTVKDPEGQLTKISQHEKVPDVSIYTTKSAMNSDTHELNKNLRSQ